MQAPDGTAYEVYGPADAPVLALIHGLGLCRHLWVPHIPALAQNHQVLTYDLYGHGDSSPPPSEASLTVFSDQLARLIDHIGISRASVIGFSIGGMINRKFGLDHRDRLEALAILNSPHDRGDDAQRQVEERARSVREQGALSTMDAALARWFTPDYRAKAPNTLQLVRDWRLKADAESYAQATWVLANGVRELIRPTPPISAPTLVMTCENDSGSTPAMSEAISAEIDGATREIVPKLQHLGLMEDPGAFTTSILRFLSERQIGGSVDRKA
ncbi:MAG: alpha/beta fold hydrolase [Pseudomonadota bacterium]